MPRLSWTPSALQDVDRLYNFLEPLNPGAAKRAVAAIRAGVKILAAYPEIGRPAADLPVKIREWPIAFGSGGYVARYRYDGKEVVILAVRHHREARF